MQQFPPLFVMTCIRLVIPSIHTRPSVCKSNISKMMYCSHYQKKVRHEEGNSQSRKMLVAGFLRKTAISYLERMIKSREEKPSHWQTLCNTSTGSSALNSAIVGYHLLHSAGEGRPSNSKLRDMCAGVTPTCPRRRSPPKYCQSAYLN